MILFTDRADAGRRLAAFVQSALASETEPDSAPGGGPVVLGLPRGGVPVAFEVAKLLAAPLDVILVRKLGVPLQPELAMGAIGEAGVRVVNERVVRAAGVTPADLAAVESRERAELERRAERYRRGRRAAPIAGRTALIVDDGIATGSTVRAACLVARAMGARRVVVAAPVAPRRTVGELQASADAVFVLHEIDDFSAIGELYGDFTQTPDREVFRLLATAAVG